MNHLFSGIRLAVIGFSAVESLGVLVAPAQAAGESSAKVVGNELQVVGSALSSHIDVLDDVAGKIRVTDNRGVIAGSGCVQSGVTALCAKSGFNQIRISAGAGDDIVHPDTGIFTIVIGGDGNDSIRNRGTGQARLNGNAGDDTIVGDTVDQLFGQDGDDRLTGGAFLRGGPGADVLKGLAGNDTLIGDDGFDVLDGGEGFDDLCLTGEFNANCEA